MIKYLFIVAFILFPSGYLHATPVIVIFPQTIIQGEPVRVQIEGSNLDSIRSLSFDGKFYPIFLYSSKPTSFIGIDLNKKPGDYLLRLQLSDGTKIDKNITVLERTKIIAPLGIPSKLGGNTPAAATNLVTTLSRENAILNSLWTNPKKLWTQNFIFPISDIFITDPYGYSRETGQYNIAHKGTDFRAQSGEYVYAMNRGVARLVKNFSIYGNTVVLDHGQGLMTFYMHLSTINVAQGTLVAQGQLIGRSGQSGYAESPHLHLSVRINNTSIDPMKFMEFFK